jgi:threonine dehydrogenase-like Zn-dependent dehydrogenase
MVYVGPRRPLECRVEEIGDPQPGGVLLKVAFAGVCGTDAHRLDGDLPEPPHPINFGHEGIGIIEVLGAGVTTDHAGASVDVPPAHGWPPPADIPNPAGFQDYASLIDTNVFYKIPDGTAPEAVIAFGCAMPTALGAMARLGGIRAGQSVVIQGSGPVGLAATFLASLSPARQVIVIGAPDERLEVAERLGATTVIALERTDPAQRREAIRDLTDGRGAEVVIEAAGRMAAFSEGMGLLADNGRYVIVGIYSGHGTVELDPIALNNRNLTVLGSLGVVHLSDYRTTVQLAARHGARLGFADLVTHRFGLEQTVEAIDAARTGAAVKAVVIPALDAPG